MTSLLFEAFRVLEEQQCPCGLTGDNCSEVASPLEDESKAMDELCDAVGFDYCLVRKRFVSCVCRCGYGGDLCDALLVPKLYNYVLSFLGIFLLLLWCAWYLYEHEILGDFADHKRMMTFQDFVIPWYPKFNAWVLFFYRLSMVILFFPLAVHQGTTSTPFDTFTMWNWLLFGLVFFLGTLISLKNIVACNPELFKLAANPLLSKDNPNNKVVEIEVMEKVFYVLFEIELVGTLFIGTLVWTILFPAAALVDQKDQVLYVDSYFVHCLNVFFMLGELGLNRLYVRWHHFAFVFAWGLIYFLFHTFYMLAKEMVGLRHCPVYPFLDMSENWYLPATFSVALVSIIFHWIMYRLSEKKYNFVETVYGLKPELVEELNPEKKMYHPDPEPKDKEEATDSSSAEQYIEV